MPVRRRWPATSVATDDENQLLNLTKHGICDTDCGVFFTAKYCVTKGQQGMYVLYKVYMVDI